MVAGGMMRGGAAEVRILRGSSLGGLGLADRSYRQTVIKISDQNLVGSMLRRVEPRRGVILAKTSHGCLRQSEDS